MAIMTIMTMAATRTSGAASETGSGVTPSGTLADGGVAAALISPLMALALGAGALTLVAAGLWLRGRERSGEDRADFFTEPPAVDAPLLDTTLEAAKRVDDKRFGPFGAGFALTNALRTAVIVLGVTALLGMGARFAPPSMTGLPQDPAEPLPPPAFAEAALLPSVPQGCVEAGAAHSGAFTVCGSGMALRFERVAFSRDGERLFDPVWAGAGQRAVLAEAKGLPVPFTFDHRAGLVAPPGGDLSAYDAFVAIGFGDEAVDGKAAKARAESRGYALQDFALQTLAGGEPADCRSDVVVHAVSLGARLMPVEGPRPQPLLVGVRAESRINGDVAAVDDMLSALFEDEDATGLIGLVPDAYGPWTVLSSQKACTRPGLPAVRFAG